MTTKTKKKTMDVKGEKKCALSKAKESKSTTCHKKTDKK